MALFEYSIGTFNFIDMKPVPPTPKQRLIVETRAGVDGMSIWKDATRGEVYRPRTVVDVADHDAAIALIEDYEEAVGGAPLVVTYYDTAYTAMVVLDVKCRIVDQIIGVGGLDGSPEALVIADWELIVR